MGYTIQQIADGLEAKAVGNTGLVIKGVSEPSAAGADDLALAMDPKYAAGLADGQARAAVLWDGADWQDMGLEAAIFVPRPRYAMAGLTKVLDPGPEIAVGIHPTAVVDPSAVIGDGAAIGPLVVIGPRARIGANAQIASHSSIAEDAVIGENAMILQGVRIGPRVVIGDRFIAQPGAVVGSDGFSFVTPEKSRVEAVREGVATGQTADTKGQSWVRIHSIGSVRIGNDVEIGANVTIDRGTIRDTQIGDGCKLDNMVHLAHNVILGRDCALAGMVGIAGSTVVGDRVVMGGQVGVADNIFVGDDVVAGGGAKLVSNVPAGRAVMGYPAMKMEAHIESYKAMRRLPRLFAQVQELQKSVSKLVQKD